VLELLKNKKIPQPLIPDAVASVQGAWRKVCYEQKPPQAICQMQLKREARKVPSMPELLALKARR
jgi:invasion protein IalB